jgi:hypothetical protein
VVTRNIQAEPESALRFHGISPDCKIILARGADHPLEGELHSAQYFHGRCVYFHTSASCLSQIETVMDWVVYPNDSRTLMSI